MPDFDTVWRSIVGLEGETFRLKKGQQFKYVISGNSVVPTTTNRQLKRSQFMRAFERMPVQRPAELGGLQGPSYLFAILTDPRISAADHAFVPAPAALRGLDPRRTLLVVPASAEKALGGTPSQRHVDWCSQALRQGRERVLAAVPCDTSLLLPAWRRYMGGFYQQAGAALAEAVTDGNLVIISGGYGIVPAREPIGWYDRALDLSDWPAGVLEAALIGEAHRAGAETVVAFAAAGSGYADVVRGASWSAFGLTAHLVTVDSADSDVSRGLGLAFKAFWNEASGYPEGTSAERLG